MENIKCIVDGTHGIYVPVLFAQTVDRKILSGVSGETLDYLAEEDSASDAEFWDVWDDVLDNARIHVEGKVYRLHHCGDLFAVDWDNMTDEERDSFGLGE